MIDTPSFQDLLGQFSEAIFVGRIEQLRLFDQWINAISPPFLILAVSGQGGVGKTTLLAHFQRKAEAAGAIHAYVDEEQLTPLDVMVRIAEHMRRQQQPCTTFDERHRKYRELKEQIEGDPKAPKGFLDFAVRGMARVGMRSLRRIPVAGEFADVFLAPEAENQIIEETSAFAEYVRQRFTNRDERTLLLETDKELATHLLADLSRIAEVDQVFLFFDTYEQTAQTLDGWLRAVLAGEYGRFSSRIRFVIAGRYPLGQAWTKFRRAVRQVEIEPFIEEEALQFLLDAGITDASEQNHLMELSERLPVLLALLVSAPNSAQQSVATSAVDRFLQGLSSSQREAALLFAIPRWFDLDAMKVLLSDADARITFEWLSRAHFVRETEDGWRYHDVVRTILLAYMRHRSPAEYAAKHDQMTAYYSGILEVRRLSVSEPGSDRTARKLSNEFHYHKLSADPIQGLSEFCTGFFSDIENYLASPAYLEQFLLQKAVVLKQVAEEIDSAELGKFVAGFHSIVHEETSTLQVEFMCSLVHESMLSRHARCIAFAYLGLLYIDLEQLDAATDILSEATSIDDNSPFVNLVFGMLLFYRCEYDLALTRLALSTSNHAKEYSDNIADLHTVSPAIYYWRGRIHLALQEYAAAAADFTRAIELQPENGYFHFWRGYNDYIARELPAAVTAFTRAIELQPDNGHNYMLRGQTHLVAQEYAAAAADFTKAIELQPNDGYNYHFRGQTYLKAEEYAYAAADFGKAIELQPTDGNSYYSRGCAHIASHEYAAAIADFTKAIELQPEDGRNYDQRGRSNLASEKYAEATADFTKTIELQPENSSNYFLRGLTYIHVDDYAAATADFAKAIELQPEDGYNYYWRGSMYYVVKEYAAAVTDFAKAIELRPEHDDSYHWRGRTFFELQEYAAAARDFAKAIELQPQDSRNYHWRGRTYCELQEYAAAAQDLDKAIELQPQDSRNYQWRGHTHSKMKEYAAAAADFEKAIELLREDGND